MKRKWLRFLVIIVTVISSKTASAQIQPDSSLGSEKSTITPNQLINGIVSEQIEGGATRGANLFHSFEEFNVKEGQGAYFVNPGGIENILTRITGNNASQILGVLGVLGNANLFFINPNGIIFGPNASLDLSGSFVGSTANSIKFADGVEFSASNPQAPPLLTINIPIGLQYGTNPEAIINQSTVKNNSGETVGLEVKPGKTLALVGGNVFLEGGNLTANGGRIELGSVSGLVTITPINQGWEFEYKGSDNFGEIKLSGEAKVNSSGESGGSIQVQGSQIILTDGSQIRANTLGGKPGGSLQVTASEFVEITGMATNGQRSGLFAETQGIGNAGNLNINTGKLIIRDGAQISSSTNGDGRGGNITIRASESVELLGKDTDNDESEGFSTGLFSESQGNGDGGNVTIETGSLIIESKARISTNTFKNNGEGGDININASESVEMKGTVTNNGSFFTGLVANTEGVKNAGNITIQTRQLMAFDGAEIISFSFGSGNAGKLTVNASESVEFSGATKAGVIVNSFLASATFGAGNAGDVIINTGKLILLDGGQIGSGTFGAGNSGNVVINAKDFVDLIGQEPIDKIYPSGLFAQADFGATGNGGNLTLTTGRLTIRDGARISAGTLGGSTGAGGNLTVIARDSIELSGKNTYFIPTTGKFEVLGSSLFSQSDGAGNAGTLRVETGELIVTDGAEVTVSAEGSGTAGNLEILARSILLDNQGLIKAETAAGSGGNITLQLQNLLELRHHSQITATAGRESGTGDGGNINIESSFIFALPSENSDITANAFQGRGGNININALGVFGMEFRPSQTPLSDITASSEFGQSGEVAIANPEITPSPGALALDTDIIDAAQIISQSLCNQQEGNNFVITGRGGLPSNPGEKISTRVILIELGSAGKIEEIAEGINKYIVEADGWEIDPQGNVVLTTPKKGRTLVKEGLQAYEAEEYSIAATLWQQAAEFFAATGDRLNYAMTLSDLAAAYQELGNWEQAITAINTSLEQLNLASPSPQQKRFLANALNTRGSLELLLGRTETAAATWLEASNLSAQAGDKAGVIRSSANYSQALLGLGLNLQAVKVLEDLQGRIVQGTDSERSRTVTKEQISVIRSLGDALRLVGNVEKSQEVLQESLTIATELQSPKDIGAVLLSLGNTAWAAGDTKTALDYYQQATSTQSKKIKLEAQLNQFNLLVSQKRLLAAKNLASQLQKQINQIPMSRVSVYAKINFAQSLNQLDVPPEEIAKELELALQQAKSIGDKRGEAYALGYLGSHYENNQLWETARQLTEEALLLSQEIKAPDIAYRWQWQLGRILKTQGDIQGAIAAYTDAFKILKSLRADLVATNRELQFSFRDTVAPVYRELVGLLLLSPTQEQQNLVKAREIMEELRLAELDNFFQDACSTAKPVEIDQIDQKAAIIYPIVLPDRLEVIVSLPGKPLQHYSTPVTQNQVEITLERLQQNLFGDPVTRLSLPDEYLADAQTVYNWLIRPMESQLAGSEVETLVFVPDGGFGNIPMAVLHDGEKHLIEKYAVALTPGLQLLDPQPLTNRELNALTGGLTKATQGFPPLPNVELEINAIQEEIPSHVLMNQEFTSAAVAKDIAASPHPIIHLATHGQFSSKAEDTFILTWDNRINALELNELLRRESEKETVELLVLSACQTATGDNRAALGLAGVAVRAGARSTLATLWFVDDEATSIAMSVFYRELGKADLTKAEALRRAQVSLLQNPQFQHPFFWSPFVLVGNWL